MNWSKLTASLNIFRLIESFYPQTLLAVFLFTGFLLFAPADWLHVFLSDRTPLNPATGLVFLLVCCIFAGNTVYSLYINIKYWLKRGI